MQNEHHQSPNLLFETKCEAFRQGKIDEAESGLCRGRATVRICMSVYLSGTAVNQETSPSSACSRGRTGASYRSGNSCRILIQGNKQQPSSWAKSSSYSSLLQAC